jgi:hypothetical protein
MVFNKLGSYQITCTGGDKSEKHFNRSATKKKYERTARKSGGKSKLDR